ncbi:unnamed protein product [Chironomus riparius]|uniref:GB1/RHD3-type G domain-containing protein n=1 Tax=Chironomus riparius TaxID=315576 RepID=A0A9P0NNJ0_9DIPT|nr:unnamed protein product [Chironomus riparius]
MTSDQKFGKAINILSFMNSKEIVVDDSELDKIFGHPEIQDRKVVIMSIIGAFRGGKSFFLDYCLRFLYAHFPSINNPWEETQCIFETNDSWMGESDEPLTGFSWRSGTKRDTTGIIMWNDVFLHTLDRTGEKIAIFVMDTQGLFDNESTPADNSRIFALGNLISSIQLLNLMNRAQEDHFQYLQFATEFAKFAGSSMIEKPFQNLTFLIRDWNNDDEYSYGTAGGNKYIKEVLSPNNCNNQELQSVRETIFECFNKIECCLLPYPGKIVASRKNYDGRWSEMNEEFRSELKTFIEFLLMPDNLIIKQINSIDVNVKDMSQYLKNFFTIFQSTEVPRTSSIYEFTVESHMNSLVKKCVNDYKMTVYRNSDLITKESMPIIHEKCKEKALVLYSHEKKMGSSEHDEKFRTELIDEIDKFYEYFNEQSEQKSKEIEAELMVQHAAIVREQQQRLEATEALIQAEERLRRLEDRQNQIEAAEYERQRMMYEARVHAEQLRTQDMEMRFREQGEFRRTLISVVGVVALVGATVVTGGLPAGMSAVTEGSYAIVRSAAAVEEAVIAVESVWSSIKRCLIM